MKHASLLAFSLFCCAQALAATATEEIAFDSHGVTLRGSVVIPDDVHAAVVFVHGSGKQLRNLRLAEALAREGIAALVYDKRGAGQSGGDYEQDQSVSGKNIALLADDALAAVAALAVNPALQRVPMGLAGISQAGWIAPVAARKSDRVKFLVMWSGPVCKVSEEDIFSKFTNDGDSDDVPSYREALNARRDKYLWPDFLGRDTDSNEDLAALSIPGLWIFSDNDASIPVDLSLEKLRALRKAGHRYDYVLFSGLGHNNIEHTLGFATAWMKRLSARQP
ncbi:MAG TPA: alpha/beta hydrolase [Steroidobacteraceae bacterium]|nr:alpha/beta hydrolase [Steroidobacteraceae bacterium]